MADMQDIITKLKNKVLAGDSLTEEEAYQLAECDSQALREAAAEVTAHFGKPVFESCSIINARSGNCPENCKWCAQSGHFHTNADVYPIVEEGRCLEEAHYNDRKGVKRFSLVTSGRSTKGKALAEVCRLCSMIAKDTNMQVCASLGLLNKEELQQLWDSGVHRYHCNLETAPSHFATLCTTHTIDDKLRTIAWAREIGFQICSGGIIGMGETRRQRVEFALKLREAHPQSIPINLLNPIPGTPLENTPLISEDEVLDTIAIFRLVHPQVELRFAGGRERLSRECLRQAIRIGMNGAIVGDLLTTIGSKIDADKALWAEHGYN